MRLLLIIFILLTAVSIQALTVVVPKAPPAIPLVKAASGKSNIKLVFYRNVLTEVLPRIVRGERAVYMIPVNVAAKLRNRGKKIKLLAVTSTGLLSIVSRNKITKTLTNLNKKKIYIPAPGSSPDIVSRYLFKKAGVTPVIGYRSAPEAAALYIHGRIDTVILPEPYATLAATKGKETKSVIQLRDIWMKSEKGSGIPQTALVTFQPESEKEKREIENFLEQLSDSVAWVNSHPADSAKYAKNLIGLDSAIVSKSIPRMNLSAITGSKIRESVRPYLEKLLKLNPASVGGKLPDEGFYPDR